MPINLESTYAEKFWSRDFIHNSSVLNLVFQDLPNNLGISRFGGLMKVCGSSPRSSGISLADKFIISTFLLFRAFNL